MPTIEGGAPLRRRSFSTVRADMESVIRSRNSSTSRILYPPKRETRNSFCCTSSGPKMLDALEAVAGAGAAND